VENVCVVGSVNLDLNTYAERFPAPGETVPGRRFTTGYGGKGANQAVMAARLGGAVALVARVGRDLFGRDMVERFRAEGIDTRHVTLTDGLSTGTAVITVDAAGRNTIVVTPGANGALTAADVDAARGAIELSRVLVCQQEVPANANLAAMRLAKLAGVPVVYNPAPVGDGMPDEAYGLADVLCPNEHELALLARVRVDDESEVVAAARQLQSRGARSVVVTLGERGCLVVPVAGKVTTIPAPAVEVIDTTGAGDAFIGSLAFFLSRGESLTGAARRANHIAALSVTLPGTQTSFPRAADLSSDVMGP
jgi:ribokinase